VRRTIQSSGAACAVFALLLSCGGKSSKPKPAVDPTVEQTTKALTQKDLPPGLAFTLSSGTLSAPRSTSGKVAQAQKLGNAALQTLLNRLPAFNAKAGDTKAFHFRPRSLPAPRPGKTVKTQFPPPISGKPPVAVNVKPGELSVLRFAPEGKVPIAPHLSITFSRPMVAVTSHAGTVKSVPVTLNPQPPGNWRWVGTRTLLFDPKVRFPQATLYKVNIPAGTKSANGEPLKSAKSFTFATPAPRMLSHWPSSGPQPLDPYMFIMFDQKIDASAVLAKIEVKAAGKRYGISALTAAQIEGNKQIKRLVAAAKKAEHEGRYVAFRLEELLPKDTTVTVTIAKGTPSAEGPLKTTSDQTYSFRTFPPLRIEKARCGWGGNCPPGRPFSVRFNNPLDAEDYQSDRLRITPDLPRYRSHVSGRYMTIRGNTKGRTTYKVIIPAALRDKFGQTLGKDEELTFDVGSANPRMWGPSGLVVLDPGAKRRTFDVFSINYTGLAVKMYKVQPKDWDDFAAFMKRRYDRRNRPTPPGKLVLDKTVPVKKVTDEMVETPIDLSPALDGGFGHAVIIVEPSPWDKKYRPPTLFAWVQATNIGLDAFVDSTDLLAWTTDLNTGKPLQGVKLSIEPQSVSGSTDAKGNATLGLPTRAAKQNKRSVLIARKGKDLAMLPQNTYWWSNYGGWYRSDRGESLRWYVYDDRKMYRPKETVKVKGWMRVRDNREGGDIGGLGGQVSSVSWTLYGPRNNKLKTGKTKVSALGGFNISLDLPGTPNLGWARLQLRADGNGKLIPSGRNYTHRFQIQEFRRPEFEVKATASEGPHLVGGSADVTVKAKYYAGGPLPNAETRWWVRTSPGYFTPPKYSGWVFGSWVPWWESHNPNWKLNRNKSFSAKTDAGGSHVLHIDFESISPPRPMSVIAQATVMDVNRQAWTSAATLLVHPSDYYAGLKTKRWFVEKGKPIEVEVVAVDHDGKPAIDTEVKLRAVRLDWKYVNGRYKTEEVDEQKCQIKAAKDPGKCSFATKEGGTYKITARLVDKKGRPNQTDMTVWVSGGKRPPARNVTQEKVTLIPDKKEYAGGDTARILVQAPFYPAEALLTIRRSGIVRTERFRMKEPSHTLEIPIKDAHVPNLYVQVDLVGAAPRIDADGKPNPKLPKRTAFAKGALNLRVPPHKRTLKVDVEPHKRKIEPGGETSINVVVRNAAGEPVSGAELAVVVVDESVLALSSYNLPDPIAAFYGSRGPGASDYHIRSRVKLARPEVGALNRGPGGGKNGGDTDKSKDEKEADDDGAAPPAPPAAAEATKPSPKKKASRTRASAGLLGRGAGGQSAPKPIAVRKNFDALALFAPEVTTNASGRATVPVKLPDSLTRYRVMVVAVHSDKYFGKGESNITARKPLMLRPSPPRFLNFGDKFELPVVLQNQTDDPMKVELALRATNAAITDGAGRQITVAANDRVEVRIPMAAEMPGTARMQIGAASGSWADAAELSLPVWTPATTEAFATYGVIDKGAVKQPVAMPEKVVKEFGGLEITTTSTQLHALTDAFIYLVSYPYECAEQISSRVMSIAALKDVLTAFEAKGLPSPARLRAHVAEDLRRLNGLQNNDGGFAFWRRGHSSWPYISIHVAHALTRAQQKGFKVKPAMLARSKRYLQNIERHIPGWYPPEVRRTLIAYALYVRKRMGDKDTARARRLLDEGGGMKKRSMEAIGWLLSVLSKDNASRSYVAKIHRHLANKTVEDAGKANWVTSYADGAHLILHSSRRVDAIILEALIDDRPKSDLIVKVVRGLLAHRKRGRWGNTQENAFVLLALDRYFNVFEKVTPNFVARAWLGDKFAGEHAFRGRSTKRMHIDVPMSYLAKMGKADLILNKRGRGRLYYRVGMTYAPASLKLDPADHGFAVTRSYEGVDDPADVKRLADGTWKIKAGTRVRVRLTMVATNRRYHVALVDPLPAGLEPQNPALAVTGAIPQDKSSSKSRGRYWWWNRTWYEHQNMRDERVEAFTSLLWAGVHEYTYVARATTPGQFVVPPTKAEEMYHPETFGRSASDKVIVE
jgi:uncharacterized protein YfaS (alpha-2-macroglobulin family)